MVAPSPLSLPSKTRVDKAGERLAGWLSGEVDLERDRAFEEIRIVRAWRAQHAYPMTLIAPGLRNWVTRYSTHGLPPGQRLKRLIQIVQKLNRHDGMKLSRMQDVGGCRVVLATPHEVSLIATKIERYWSPRPKDYRDTPRSTGYRALHMMVEKRDRISGQPRIVEIQIRTAGQHSWAEEVARTGKRLGYALQDGVGPLELLDYFRLASELLWVRESGRDVDTAFVERFGALREQVRPYFVTNE